MRAAGLLATIAAIGVLAPGPPQRQRERLDRGLVAQRTEDGAALVSWRLLGDDPPEASFRLSRDGKEIARLGQDSPTCFVDRDAPRGARYRVEGAETTLRETPYLEIPLLTPAGYTPNDASVGDLDGDGSYEIVLHQAGRSHDNSQNGPTDPPILQAYRLDGTLLWQITLGKNVREGAHYTQFLVFDFDGDGRAEVACKTADGTVDGAGKVIGDPMKDWRSPDGRVLDGPEFLTLFDGRTGRALASTDYLPARGRVAAWGDSYGNRVDRFLAGVAYLDGKRPSLVFCRGYYTRTVLVAWDWRDGALTRRWTFDSDQGWPRYAGQGNHNLSIGDVDGDGRDEIVYGAMCVDDDGRGLYSTGLGHGDALHLSDLDPNRPGLEVFDIHEHNRHDAGAELRDARTGARIWGKPSPDVGRGVAMDIDPRHPGCEIWASGPGLSGLWSVSGATISETKPRSCNFGIWWDGDRLRELLDGAQISKWHWTDATETVLLAPSGVAGNNGTKNTPCLSADILGDWREELLVRAADNRSLRLYTTPFPTTHRLVTLMHDPQYRLAVAWQNVGYNQPPHPGFFLGEPAL